ncbi:sulfotransferase family 2 domain-containing protein [Pseudoalteromonas tunicata]|jgi:hypothetical protein|uniref:Uncharacterized protein n=1 Tax=Pseudoalteromonas tunicata D2 TaxID=87626 RepID=A4C6E3_9GAMM|nr:sulfotransferase family 2 domain-containing protein [Pseudoalteromonas tunicata]ATC95522.1 hypothetical protein PTUN_a3139 [Pseudoalteromonas tunicata]AXT31095.1 hypothetical protein D1819_09980 [Pseudoalteromonas tunicata]EAR29547.1 hypothetical protein PTD2_12044 [Pseudoalteromonas tunicata D2]MDP4982523.1 sulfotransferase family protein [Pseudoalteromonas tunicata]
MNHTLNELVALVDASFYRSYADLNELDDKATFFYHIPKTGGLSLYYALYLSSIGQNKLPLNLNHTEVVKYDEAEFFEQIKALPCNKKTFYASHFSFPEHEKFDPAMNLMTIVREPFKRIVSSFTYYCMRHQKVPNIIDFVAFYKDEANQNVMSKQLFAKVPEHCNSSEFGQTVFDHLQQHFTYFASTEHITLFIEYYLSKLKLSNVLMPRMNETSAEYLFDASAVLDEVLALNQADLTLYSLICQSPKLPDFSAISANSISNLTTVIASEDTDQGSKAKGMTGQTQEVHMLLNNLKQHFKDEPIKVKTNEIIGAY